MKTIKFFLVVILILATQLSNAQSKSDRMYDALSNEDGVTNFAFTKNMTDAVNIDLGTPEKKKR